MNHRRSGTSPKRVQLRDLHLRADDYLHITLRPGCTLDDLIEGLPRSPIELTVMGLRPPPNREVQLRYKLPRGGFIDLVRGAHTPEEILAIKRPTRGVHRALLLTRYPLQSIRCFPSAYVDSAAADLARNGIFIHVEQVVNDQVQLRISASDAWTILREELVGRAKPAATARTAGDAPPVAATLRLLSPQDALVLEQFAAFAEQFEQAAREVAAMLDRLAPGALPEELRARFLAIDAQIQTQCARLRRLLEIPVRTWIK
jgi:hypothetical protein